MPQTNKPQTKCKTTHMSYICDTSLYRKKAMKYFPIFDMLDCQMCGYQLLDLINGLI